MNKQENSTIANITAWYCQTCTRMLQTCLPMLVESRGSDEGGFHPHHKLGRDLAVAAASGCGICHQLLQAWGTFGEQMHAIDSLEAEPIIRYTMNNRTLHFRIRSDGSEPDHRSTFRGKTLLSFTVESFGDWKARDLVHHGTINSNFTGSPEVLDFVKRCLCICLEGHGRCRQRQAGSSSLLGSYLPPRLIKIDDNCIRIVDTHLQPLDPVLNPTVYNTLSYCWGRQPRHLTLTSSNYDQLRQGIPLQSLPATFRDAIAFTLYLKVDYVWIDSLCILQEGPGSEEDWRRHVHELHQIYANGLINIAAELGEDADSGCFVHRDVTAVKPCLIDLSQWILHYSQIKFENTRSSNIVSIVPCRRLSILTTNSSKRSPLHERGWVLQERLLAPRVVSFTRNSISWHCTTAYRTETRLQTTMEKARLQTDFYALVAEYSALHLTKAHDKLPAIAALAQIACEKKPSGYVAGLLTARLAEGLTWRRRGKALRRHGSDWRAPSWSWASCEGEIVFPHELQSPTLVCDVLDIGVNLLDQAYPFGQITSAFIIIIATILELKQPAPVVPFTSQRATWCPAEELFSARSCTFLHKSSDRAVLIAIDDSELDYDLTGALFAIVAHGHGSYAGLILVPTSPVRSSIESPAEWRRIGSFEAYYDWKARQSEALQAAEEVTLKIV